MTIRILQQWNGYSPDQIVSNLSGTEETRLIGLGFATADLDGANDGVLVDAKLTTTPSGGVAIIDPSDGSLLGLIPASYTWAGKPAASASNNGQTIRITDVGHSASGSLLQSDGTIWRPVNGSILIASAFGSVAAPLASFTGATAGSFTLSGGNPSIPASLLPVGACVKAWAMMRRHGTNGVGTFNVRLGTANAATDPVIQAIATTATDAKDASIDVSGWLTSSTTFTTQNWLSPQGVGVSAIVDRTGSINTAAAMYLSFDMAGANALDSFDLIAYRLSVEF